MRRFSVFFLCVSLLTPLTAFADDTIRLGASLPLTGEIASYGDDLKAGIELACADFNARGGVLGKKLEPIFEDNNGDPKAAVAVANRMLGEHIAVAIDGVSRTSMPTAPIFVEEISLSSTSPAPMRSPSMDGRMSRARCRKTARRPPKPLR